MLRNAFVCLLAETYECMGGCIIAATTAGQVNMAGKEKKVNTETVRFPAPYDIIRRDYRCLKLDFIYPFNLAAI